MSHAFAPDDPRGIGLEWVRARLAHDPRTRPLRVAARARDDTLLLEGAVECLADKQVAGVVARASQCHGGMENRIVVEHAHAGASRVPLLAVG